MNTEAEHVVKEVANVSNVADNRGRVISKATRVLTFRERQALEQEQKDLNRMLGQANAYATANGGMSQDGRRTMSQRMIAIEDRLKAEAPREVNGETRDVLNRRVKELEDKIRVGMPSTEVMRRNPPGAVDQHRKWERANKAYILERQNILRTLNPDDDSKDLTNIDMIRPSGLPQGTSTFMPDATIPGHFAMTPAAKENWPENMPEYGTVNSPLRQAAKNEDKPAVIKTKRVWTDEQRAAARDRGLKLAESAKRARDAKSKSSAAALGTDKTAD